MKKVGFEVMMWTVLLTIGGSVYEVIASHGLIYNWRLLIMVILVGGTISTTIYTNKHAKYFELSRDFQWSFIISYLFAFAYIIVNLVHNFLEHHALNIALIPGFIAMFFLTLHDLVIEQRITRIPQGK